MIELGKFRAEEHLPTSNARMMLCGEASPETTFEQAKRPKTWRRQCVSSFSTIGRSYYFGYSQGSFGTTGDLGLRLLDVPLSF